MPNEKDPVYTWLQNQTDWHRIQLNQSSNLQELGSKYANVDEEG